MERGVEAVGVAEGGDVGGGGAFAEHLDDGVAGDEMDEEEDDGDDDPEDGEGEEDAADEAWERLTRRFSAAISRASAVEWSLRRRERWSSTRTRAMRRPAISATM